MEPPRCLGGKTHWFARRRHPQCWWCRHCARRWHSLRRTVDDNPLGGAISPFAVFVGIARTHVHSHLRQGPTTPCFMPSYHGRKACSSSMVLRT